MKKNRRAPSVEPTAKVCRDVGPIIYDTTLGRGERYMQSLADVGMAYHLWRYEDQAHRPREERAVELRRSELDRAYRRSLDILFEKPKPIVPAQEPPGVRELRARGTGRGGQGEYSGADPFRERRARESDVGSDDPVRSRRHAPQRAEGEVPHVA